ncbi:MAG: ROK family protein, partial [Candidatus Aenigmarchaeota archaeon]|nr:ROK family protein [Candidatus Aenigmarchaeota archaeon]
IHHLGIGISTLVNVLNPDIIVIGGGVSQLPSPVYTRLEKEVKRFALPVLTRNLKIVRHKISDSAGLLGAAALVFENKITQ